jgi:hypothetical protein
MLNQAADALGLSHWTAANKRESKISPIKLGRRVLIEPTRLMEQGRGEKVVQ